VKTSLAIHDFAGRGRYDSITFPQVPVGCKLDMETKRLRMMNVGQVKVVLHRPLEGMPKTATISRSSTGKWYACFSCEYAEPSPLPDTGQQVGIDVGLKVFATLSTGDEIPNPRFFRQEEHALATVQRRLAKEEKGTPEREGCRKVVPVCTSELPGGAVTSLTNIATASWTPLL
jgi:putative transposase